MAGKPCRRIVARFYTIRAHRARTVYVVTVHTRILIRVFPLIPLPFIKTSFGENRARREIANNVASKFAASLGSMAKRETVAGLFIVEWNDTSGQTFEDSCQGNCDKCFALRRKLIYFANLFLSITHLFTFSLYTSDSWIACSIAVSSPPLFFGHNGTKRHHSHLNIS